MLVLDITSSDRARYTFVFYNREGEAAIEERLLYKEMNSERAIQSYIEEMLYGPISQDLKPVFLQESSLLSLLYRDGTVFINLSEEAAFPVQIEADFNYSFTTMEQGVFRNFPAVQAVRIFVMGHEV